MSFRHAFELLASGAMAFEQNGNGAKRATVPKLECPLATGAGDGELMAGVVDYYHGRLAGSEDAKA